mmetsp:Transcript_6219/g.18141  ORF Transcript_6219/g.18141 Transcript_6219/m.18141 type:complete len:349 (-) Transcript_6219:178-1224(-)
MWEGRVLALLPGILQALQNQALSLLAAACSNLFGGLDAALALNQVSEGRVGDPNVHAVLFKALINRSRSMGQAEIHTSILIAVAEHDSLVSLRPNVDVEAGKRCFPLTRRKGVQVQEEGHEPEGRHLFHLLHSVVATQRPGIVVLCELLPVAVGDYLKWLNILSREADHLRRSRFDRSNFRVPELLHVEEGRCAFLRDDFVASVCVGVGCLESTFLPLLAGDHQVKVLHFPLGEEVVHLEDIRVRVDLVDPSPTALDASLLLEEHSLDAGAQGPGLGLAALPELPPTMRRLLLSAGALRLLPPPANSRKLVLQQIPRRRHYPALPTHQRRPHRRRQRHDNRVGVGLLL